MLKKKYYNCNGILKKIRLQRLDFLGGETCLLSDDLK